MSLRHFRGSQQAPVVESPTAQIHSRLASRRRSMSCSASARRIAGSFSMALISSSPGLKVSPGIPATTPNSSAASCP